MPKSKPSCDLVLNHALDLNTYNLHVMAVEACDARGRLD